MAVYKQSGDVINYTPVTAETAGDVVIIGEDIISVVAADIEAGQLGAHYVKGVFEFDTSDTFAAGDNAYWNSVSEEITDTDTDVYAGRVVEATANSKVLVSINFMPEYAGS